MSTSDEIIQKALRESKPSVKNARISPEDNQESEEVTASLLGKASNSHQETLEKLQSLMTELEKFLNKKKQEQEQEKNDNIFNEYVFTVRLKNLLEQLKNGSNNAFIDEFKEKLLNEYNTWNATANITDLMATAMYVGCVTSQFIALVCGFGSYGFGRNVAELSVSSLWNAVDIVAALAQGTCQLSRDEIIMGCINFSSAAIVTGSTVAAIVYYAMTENIGVAAQLLGWSWTFAIICSGIVEANLYLKSLKRKASLIEDLKDCLLDFPEITLDSLGRTDSIKLVKESVRILNFLNNNPEKYKEASLLLDAIALENAQANTHFRNACSWTACAVAMIFSSTLTTLAATNSYGTSLLISAVVLPYLNSAISLLSEVGRVLIGQCSNDVENVNQAIQQRNAAMEKTKSDNNLLVADIQNKITGKKSSLKIFKQAGDCVYDSVTSFGNYFYRAGVSKKNKIDTEKSEIPSPGYITDSSL